MVRIIWTGPARRDLKEIADYIATDSPRHALRPRNGSSWHRNRSDDFRGQAAGCRSSRIGTFERLSFGDTGSSTEPRTRRYRFLPFGMERGC